MFAQRFSVTRACFSQAGLSTVFGQRFFVKTQVLMEVGRASTDVFASFSGARRKCDFPVESWKGFR